MYMTQIPTSHLQSKKITQVWVMVEECNKIYEKNLYTSSKCFITIYKYPPGQISINIVNKD